MPEVSLQQPIMLQPPRAPVGKSPLAPGSRPHRECEPVHVTRVQTRRDSRPTGIPVPPSVGPASRRARLTTGFRTMSLPDRQNVNLDIYYCTQAILQCNPSACLTVLLYPQKQNLHSVGAYSRNCTGITRRSTSVSCHRPGSSLRKKK